MLNGDIFTCTFGNIDEDDEDLFTSNTSSEADAHVTEISVFADVGFELCKVLVKTPENSYTLGNLCVDEEALTEYTWEFDDDENFFLGVGGVPETSWLSISPFTVDLIPDNQIIRL